MLFQNVPISQGAVPTPTNRILEQQINITDGEFDTSGNVSAGTDGSFGIISFDADNYGWNGLTNASSNLRICFEAIIKSADASGTTFAHADLITFPGLVSKAAIQTNEDVYTRVRTDTCLNSLSNGNYTVQLTTDDSDQLAFIQSARLIIVQTGNPHVSETQTQIEIGYAAGTTTFGPKIWRYDDQYDGTIDEIRFEATLGGGTTATLCEINASFTDCPTDLSSITNAGAPGSFSLILSGDIQNDLGHGKYYGVKATGLNIANAKIVITQSDFTKLQTFQQMVNRSKTNSIGQAQQFFNEFDPENFGVNQTGKSYVDKINGIYQVFFESTFGSPNSDDNVASLSSDGCGTSQATLDEPATGPLFRPNRVIIDSTPATATVFDTCLGSNTNVTNSWLIINIQIPPPLAPTNFEAKTIGTDSIVWGWDVNSDDEDSFSVIPNPNGCTAGAGEDECTEELDANTTVTRDVRALRVDPEGESTSNSFTGTTLSLRPVNPFSETDFDSSKGFYIDVSWDAPGTLGEGSHSGFNVWRFPNLDCTGSGKKIRTAIPATSISDTGLDPNTQYCYSIRSINSVGIENPDDIETAQTTLNDQTPPGDFQLLAPGKDVLLNTRSVVFSWTASSDDLQLAGYRIVVNGFIVATVDAQATERAVSLTDGLKNWHVTAFDFAGNETDSESRAFTLDATAPGLPGGLSVWDSPSKNKQLSSGAEYPYKNPYFEWSAAGDATSGVEGYYVYFGPNTNADPVVDGNFQTGTTLSSSIAFSSGTNEGVLALLKIAGIEPAHAAATGYHLRIKVRDRAGNVSTVWNPFNYVFNPEVKPPDTDKKPGEEKAIEGGVTGVTNSVFNNPAARAASVAIPAAVLLLEIPNLILLFIYLFQLIGQAFSKTKKRRFWGVVYDSMSKRPLPLVLVRLEGPTTQLAVTDREGRYGFLIDAGNYKMTASKTGYNFPTLTIANQKDGYYEPVYLGGGLEVKEGQEQLVNVHIPLDPNRFTGKKSVRGLAALRENLFFPLLALNLIGLIFTLAYYNRTKSIFYLLLGASYGILLAVNLRRLYLQFIKPLPPTGTVTDINGVPVEGATVYLIDPETGNKIGARRTTESGRYGFFVRRLGEYVIHAEKEGFIFEDKKVVVESEANHFVRQNITGTRLDTQASPLT